VVAEKLIAKLAPLRRGKEQNVSNLDFIIFSE